MLQILYMGAIETIKIDHILYDRLYDEYPCIACILFGKKTLTKIFMRI